MDNPQEIYHPTLHQLALLAAIEGLSANPNVISSERAPALTVSDLCELADDIATKAEQIVNDRLEAAQS